MVDEYEFYQGAVLRQLAVASHTMMFRPFIREGRINAFVVNAQVGVFIKHSTKRMSPWRFTFTIDQAADLLDLEAKYPDSYVVFVCETDGIVTLDVGNLHQIVSFQETESAWVRIERPPRSQYALSGNRAELPFKIANGVTVIHEILKERARQAFAKA